ncbi:hypothetical protein ACOMHN_050592 [Nucella lapillus]
MSNAGALHSREDAAVSGTEEFVRNHASSGVGTEMLRAPPQTSSLDDSVIDARPQRTVQPSHQTVTTSGVHGGIDMVSTTIQHIDVLPTSTSEVCCNATAISPSLTLGSDSSFPVHAPASGSSAPDISNNVERLPTAKKMHVVKLREDAGFITTPGFNNSQRYPGNIYDQHCIVMSPSGGRTMLLSFSFFDLEDSRNCHYDYLEVYTGSGNNTTQLWKKCGFQTIPAEILSEPAVCLRFKSDYFVQRRGFNVTYSFLPGSPDDYRLDDEFECSNMDPFHMSLHFNCNFALECHDKRDEMNCSYSSQECPGLVRVGNKCYTNKFKKEITWLAANRECISHKQTLHDDEVLCHQNCPQQCKCQGLAFVCSSLFVFHSYPDLRYLHIDSSSLTAVDLTSNTYLVLLRISNCKLKTISSFKLDSLRNLQTLDLRDNLLVSVDLNAFVSLGTLLKSYPVKMLRYLSKLKHVWANDFKMCCQAALPEGFDLEHCHAPQDNIASCDDLLRSAVYRSFLWIIAVFAMIGNTGSFVARLLLTKELRRSSFGLFVLNLSISDFLMGVYLTMIGVADQTFRGQYWWRVDSWKNSAVCKIAGFLSLLSSEVSAFFICLITIDRFLVLRFPFSRLHFKYRSTLVACVFAWIVGLVLAGVPLLPLISQWDFYGQTGICLPLPFTSRGAFSGYFYSFGVMIVLNFVLFMLIAIGQFFIYWSVRTRHKSKLRKHIKSSDVAIARRLIAIVLSDFMCWFPTGILGLWAFTDNTVNSDINVTVAIFVMPFNAALNPFLYTLNLVMDKRRKAAEARMMLRLQATMHSEITRVDTVTKRRSGDMAVRENRHLGGGQELPLELQACPLPKLAALNQVDNWLKDGTLSLPEISSLIDTI